MRRTRRNATWLVLVLVASACSSSSDNDGATPTSEQPRAADVEIAEDYVTAMASEEVAEAQAYRCAETAIPDDDIELVSDHMRRLVDENGPLTFSRAEVVGDPPAFDALAGLEDPVVLRVWVAFDAEEREQPLLYFIGTDDGERRICGYAQARTAALTDATDEQLADLGATDRTVEELVDVPVPADFTEVDQSGPAGPEEGLPAPIDSGARAFQDPSGYGGASVTARRFSSPDSAREWGEQTLYRSLGDAVGLNVLVEPEGVFAVQLAGFSETLVQPADTWPEVTITILRYGEVVVDVRQLLHPDGPDSVWLGLVEAVHDISDSQAR